MECRSVNCNGLYVKVHQWGEMPLNNVLDKQYLFFYMFHFDVTTSNKSLE
jgi:hypothetical protein